MSVKQTSELWKRKCEPRRKHLLHAICDCADDDGRAFPSVNYLVWKTDLPRSTVIQYMQEFRLAGVLEDAGRRSTIECGIGKHSAKDTAVVWVRLEQLPLKEPWRNKSKSVVQPPDYGESSHRTTVVQSPDLGSPVDGFAIRKNRQLTINRTYTENPQPIPKSVLDRYEKERRQNFTEAARKGLRDFQKYPLEDWELNQNTGIA